MSATLDHEATFDERRRADEHLASCRECRQWSAALGGLVRHLRERPAEPVPDLSSAVVARVAFERRRRIERLRVAIGVLLVAELVLGLVGIWRGFGVGSFHDTRHFGWLGAVVVIAVAMAIWRTGAGRGTLPLLAAVVATMAGTALIQVSANRSGGAGESHHIVEIIGLVTAWLVAGRLIDSSRSASQFGRGSQLRATTQRLCVA